MSVDAPLGPDLALTFRTYRGHGRGYVDPTIGDDEDNLVPALYAKAHREMDAICARVPNVADARQLHTSRLGDGVRVVWRLILTVRP